jgi:hypothetical protein
MGVGLYTFRNRRVTFTYTTIRDYEHLAQDTPDIEELFNDPAIRFVLTWVTVAPFIYVKLLLILKIIHL